MLVLFHHLVFYWLY